MIRRLRTRRFYEFRRSGGRALEGPAPSAPGAAGLGEIDLADKRFQLSISPTRPGADSAAPSNR